MTIIAIILAVALAIALSVISEQKRVIERQGRRLIETLDWIDPKKAVDCNGDCASCFYAEVDE